MWAAKLFGRNQIQLVECDIPQIQEDEMRVKTSVCAICGSDLRMIQNGYAGVDENHPLTLGHEISGVIDQVGKHVKGYKPGMRVSIAPNFGCGICSQCVKGDTHLCNQYQAFGINIDGGFAEYVRVPAAAIQQGNVFPLPDQVSMEDAALFEPFSCVINGQEQVQIKKNDWVLIIGSGPIGAMHAMLAQTSGAAKVFVYDISHQRMEECIRAVKFAIPIEGSDLESEVFKLTNGRGMDVCITACSSQRAQEQALSLVGSGGRVLFFGGLPAGKDTIALKSNLIHYRQLSIHGSTRANLRQYREAAELVNTRIPELHNIITYKAPLSSFSEAVAHTASGVGLKTAIVFD